MSQKLPFDKNLFCVLSQGHKKTLPMGFIQIFWRKITRFHYFTVGCHLHNQVIYTIYLKDPVKLVLVRYLHINIFGKAAYFCLLILEGYTEDPEFMMPLTSTEKRARKYFCYFGVLHTSAPVTF